MHPKMRPEARPPLEDVRQSGMLILEFVAGKTFSDYQESALLQCVRELLGEGP